MIVNIIRREFDSSVASGPPPNDRGVTGSSSRVLKPERDQNVTAVGCPRSHEMTEADFSSVDCRNVLQIIIKEVPSIRTRMRRTAPFPAGTASRPEPTLRTIAVASLVPVVFVALLAAPAVVVAAALGGLSVPASQRARRWLQRVSDRAARESDGCCVATTP